MDAKRPPRADDLENAHRFGGVDMLGSHEPARRIGADGKESKIRRSQMRDPGEDRAVAEAGVAREPDGAERRREERARPEGHEPVRKRPSAPMDRRREGGGDGM